MIISYQNRNIPEKHQTLFEGKRFYRPGVLAAYCILANIPLAVFLYGINVHRRGNVRIGNFIKILCASTIVTMTAANAFGSKLSWSRLMMPSIVIGFGLMEAEAPNFEIAISRGAKPEKWWPPLLVLLAAVLLIYLIDYILVQNIIIT